MLPITLNYNSPFKLSPATKTADWVQENKGDDAVTTVQY